VTDKKARQDRGVEWIGAIPPGWTVERLKKVSTIKSSNVDKKDYPDQIPIRLCNYVDVYYNDVIDNSIRFMKSTASELEYKKFHLSSGDVVLTKDSETPDDIAVPAYVAENIDDLVCGYHLAVMRANHKLNGKFLFRAIQSTGIKEQFYRLATGITRFGLKIRELESVLIPLPPLQEQRAIAQYLDQRCGKLDAIIVIKQQQIKTLDALRQSIIFHAVTKGLDDSVLLVDSGVEWLGKIPEGWQVKIIKREFYVKLGKMLQPLQKMESDTEEYYLKTSNIYWEGIEITNINQMWFSPLDKLNTELQYNDLLVCEGGDVGRSALWKEEITPCYIQNAINRVRPIHHCSTKFLYYWLFLLKHTGYIDAMVSRITIADAA
jgi:type I restriction enzyme, S subunit